MHYERIKKGIFLKRPNRFIAHVMIDGKEQICHVKNTGRCRELLIPGVTVVLFFDADAAKKGRKTAYDVIGVYKECGGASRQRLLINMDSQAPNAAAFSWLCRHPLGNLRREVTFGSSRLDFAFELNGRPALLEVKGVTLEENGLARFPDAPTQRGVKHIDELARGAREGFYCFVLFVIQMKDVTGFSPHNEIHPAFGEALIRAREAGVTLMAYDCLVTEDAMTIDRPVPIFLSP